MKRRVAIGIWIGICGILAGTASAQPVLCSTIDPIAFSVTDGALVSGGLAELADSDDDYLLIDQNPGDNPARTEFEVMSVSPTASPVSFEETLEGSVSSVSSVTQTIELFNWDTGTWELLDARNATTVVDSTVSVSPGGDLSRFVAPATMDVEARIRYTSSTDDPLQSRTDQFVWCIAPGAAAVPTVGEWGLAVMGLALLGGLALVTRRPTDVRAAAV